MFEALRGWLERRRTLRELRTVGGQVNRPYLVFFKEQIHTADVAKREGRSEEALEIWHRMHAQFPDLCLTSEMAMNLFVDLGPHDAAEALIHEGRRRYPRYRSLYVAAIARVAYRRGNREEALLRYKIVRRRFPRVGDGYGIAAACLGDLGRLDEAEVLLKRGVRKIPDNIDLCVLYAQAATRRRDWSEGLERWNFLWERFGHASGPLGAANCLKQLGRIAEAEQVLTETCMRFRNNVSPFAGLANLSSTKGDFDEAVQRWEVVLQRFPWFEQAYTKAAEALCKVGREAEADKLLRTGMTRFRRNLSITLEYARRAHSSGDWAEAKARWAMVRDRFPDCAEAREQEKVTLGHTAANQ